MYCPAIAKANNTIIAAILISQKVAALYLKLFPLI
jgi:hypothetical protein